MLEFVPLLVLNFQLVAYPIRPPTFVLGVEVAFVVWDVLWRCVRVTIAAVFGTVFAACGMLFPFLIFLSIAALRSMFAPASPLRRWWRGGTRGGRGWRRFEHCLFVHPVAAFAHAPALASVLAVGCCICALRVGTVRGETQLCRCTSWRRLSNPWLTISTFSPGAGALRRSLASSAPVCTFRISLMEAVLWVWLYMYFSLMVG